MMDAFPQAGASRAELVIDDGDMVLRRALPAPGVGAVGPFVFLDHYSHVSRRGIGDRPHPHAGIEVISYLLQGEVHHRDSMGHSDIIGTGEVQVISAGRGMLHAEMPSGGRHGVQMWTSLPPELKHAPPTYKRFTASEIACSEDRLRVVRVLSGKVNAMVGPVVLARDTLLAHITLASNTSQELIFDAELDAAAYVLRGAPAIDGAMLEIGMFRRASRSGCIHVAATGGPCDVLLFGGVAAPEPILFSGPFVMDTDQRLRQARMDYLSGAMGTLDGVPM